MTRIAQGILLAIVIQLCALIGLATANYVIHYQAVERVTQRISLDIGLLDLDIPHTSAVANVTHVARYITKINDFLVTNDYPVRLLAIQNVKPNQRFDSFANRHMNSLASNQGNIELQLGTLSLLSGMSVSWLALLAGAAYIAWPMTWRRESVPSQVSVPTTKKPSRRKAKHAPKLIVDLRQKALYLEAEQRPVVLSNKPFCFYVALLRYCLDHGASPLIHHQAVPDTLLGFADETFKRLMELGHTKRKQPDFSTNLDKTLSEIRAALDDVFAALPAEKCHFYPPKAQGEGSRTKRHSYSLDRLDSERVIIKFE